MGSACSSEIAVKTLIVEFKRISLTGFRSCTSRSRYRSVSKQTTRYSSSQSALFPYSTILLFPNHTGEFTLSNGVFLGRSSGLVGFMERNYTYSTVLITLGEITVGRFFEILHEDP
ncbi:hypothetical protein Tco_0562722 [Tanacetum coccineum]